MFKNEEEIYIIHSTGERSKLSNGELNKKALYAFTTGKLIQLDVSNYKIAIDGTLGLYYDTDYKVSGYIEEFENDELVKINCDTHKLVLKGYSKSGNYIKQNDTYIPIYCKSYTVEKQSKQARIGAIQSTGNTITNPNYTLSNGTQIQINQSTGNITVVPNITGGSTTTSTGSSTLPTITTTPSVGNLTSTIILGQFTEELKDAVWKIPYGEEAIISTNRTKNYYKFINGKYSLGFNEAVSRELEGYYYTTDYFGTALRGTSLTINDLYYDPKSNHRLFIKNLESEQCRYDTPSQNNVTLRNIIYYRELPSEYNNINMSDANKKILETWGSDDLYQHKNHLYLFTGPCFTPETLNITYE